MPADAAVGGLSAPIGDRGLVPEALDFESDGAVVFEGVGCQWQFAHPLEERFHLRVLGLDVVLSVLFALVAHVSQLWRVSFGVADGFFRPILHVDGADALVEVDDVEADRVDCVLDPFVGGGK